jgi:hypothetical protein
MLSEITETTAKAEYTLFQRGPYTSSLTERWAVLTLRRERLGGIGWYGPWRQYVFYPATESLFSKGCMDDIAEMIAHLQKKWKARHKLDPVIDPQSAAYGDV